MFLDKLPKYMSRNKWVGRAVGISAIVTLAAGVIVPLVNGSPYDTTDVAKVKRYASCDFGYTDDKTKDEFQLTCEVDEQWERELRGADFSNADSVKQDRFSSSNEVEYRGSDALDRARKDFDKSNIGAVIVHSGWFGNEPYIHDWWGPVDDEDGFPFAVSPNTLKKITDDELEAIVDHFPNQMVAAVRTWDDYNNWRLASH